MRLMGWRCKTLLPVAGSLQQPQYATEEDTRTLIRDMKLSRPLPPISTGHTVRMKRLGQKRWDAGICKGQVGPRSYETGDNYLQARTNGIDMPSEPLSVSPEPTILRRSARKSRAPGWYNDYHMSGTA
jgi:hypothetical protein